jgi:hypothetical protein
MLPANAELASVDPATIAAVAIALAAREQPLPFLRECACSEATHQVWVASFHTVLNVLFIYLGYLIEYPWTEGRGDDLSSKRN